MKYWWDISQLTDTFQTCTAEISCGFVHQTSFSSCLCGTSGSDDNDIICELLTEGTRKWTGAAYTVETDIEKLVDLMIERIEEKRTALGI